MLLRRIVPCLALPLLVFCSAIASGLSPQQLKFLQNDPKATHLVRFEVTKYPSQGDAVVLGSLELALFGELLPITTQNFVNKAADASNGFLNSIFHRVIKDFVVQGGNLIRKEKDSYVPLEFQRFDDENFDLHHDKVGRLSMANAGPNTNGCQFFITTKETFTHLDGKHVVFGQLVSGHDTLDSINNAEVVGDKPVDDIAITKCSVTKISAPPAAAQVQIMDSVSSGYSFFMFFCVVAATAYGIRRVWFGRRRSYVDLASYKM